MCLFMSLSKPWLALHKDYSMLHLRNITNMSWQMKYINKKKDIFVLQYLLDIYESIY